jgi:hypothetical protein
MDMMRFTVAPGFDIKCDILVPCLLGLRRAFQPFDQFARELFRAHARRDLIDPVAFPTIVGAGLRVQGIPTTGVRWCKEFNQKGIFTGAQLSYTFRPRRRPKHFRGNEKNITMPSRPWHPLITKWRDFSSPITELEFVTNAAHWDYQRDRIYVRTSLQRALRHQARAEKLTLIRT